MSTHELREEAVDVFIAVMNTAISPRELALELSASTGNDWSGTSKSEMARRIAVGNINLADAPAWAFELRRRRGLKPGAKLQEFRTR